MERNARRRAEALNTFWDELALGRAPLDPHAIDGETGDLVEHLHALGHPPERDSARERVWQELQQHQRWKESDVNATAFSLNGIVGAPPAPGQGEWPGTRSTQPHTHRPYSVPWTPAQLATALLALFVLIGSLLAFGPGRPGQQGDDPSYLPAIGGTPAAPSGAHGDFSGQVAIGGDPLDLSGRSLYLKCMGEGSPTVILETGAPYMDTGSWTAIQPRIAQFTRVCAYARANVLPSDPAPTPRTVRQMADDLHALLETAGVPGPYVPTALGFGALVSRTYASTYPEEVAGLVLIEPFSEELETRWTAVLPPELQDRWLEDFWFGDTEGIAFAESYAQVRAARPLPTVPLLVIVHGDITRDDDLVPVGWPVEPLATIWKELVAQQATLVPAGRLIVAAESGPRVEAEQPAVIVDAVEQVVTAARDPSTWAAPVATPAS